MASPVYVVDSKGNKVDAIVDESGLVRLAASAQLVDSSGNPISGTNPLPVSGSISIPPGLATSANQSTEISSLSSIDSKIPAKGQATMAGSTPVTLASDQPAVPVTGTFWQSTQPISVASLPLPSGAAQDGTDGSGITQPTGGSGIRGWLSGIYKALTGTLTVDASGHTVPVSGTFWQATQPISGTVTVGNASIAVTGTFWQATQPISAASLPLPSGAATSAKQPALGTAGTASSDVISIQGIASMTPVKTDGSGVTQPVSGTVTANPGASSSSSVTSVASSASSVQLLASNSNRKAAYFFNDSNQILYLKFGTTASTSSYTVQVPAGGFFEVPVIPIYTGEIDGIWSSANGNVRITELT